MLYAYIVVSYGGLQRLGGRRNVGINVHHGALYNDRVA